MKSLTKICSYQLENVLYIHRLTTSYEIQHLSDAYKEFQSNTHQSDLRKQNHKGILNSVVFLL